MGLGHRTVRSYPHLYLKLVRDCRAGPFVAMDGIKIRCGREDLKRWVSRRDAQLSVTSRKEIHFKLIICNGMDAEVST